MGENDLRFDLLDTLEAFLCTGGCVKYRSTRVPGVLEPDEKPPAFVLVDKEGEVCGAGISIAKAVHAYAAARLGK